MESADTGSRPLFRPLIALTLGLVLLRLVPVAFDLKRAWGFDMLRTLEPWEWIASSLLPFVVFLPPAQRLIQFLADACARRTSHLLLWGIGGLLLALILLFPMSTFFYGDGGNLIPQIHLLAAGKNYDVRLLLNAKSSPLAGLLLLGIAHGVPALVQAVASAGSTTALYPFLALGLLGVAVLTVALRFVDDTVVSVPALLLLMGTAAGLFFFSYAEFYLPFAVAVFLYLLSSMVWFETGRMFPMVATSFLLAVGCHFLALALLPSFAYILALRLGKVDKTGVSNRVLFPTIAGAFGLCLALYFLLGFAHSDSRIVMPLLPVDSPAGTLSYTLLSAAHLLDLLNLILLLAPIPAGVLLIFAFRKPTQRTLQSGSGQFFLFAFLFAALALFVSNTSLGLARDWDIAAPLGIILSVMALAALRHAGISAGQQLTLAILTVLLALPWYTANIRPDSSARRFAALMELDAKHMYKDYALSGYETLRKYYRNTGAIDEEIHFARKKIEAVEYPSNYGTLLSANAQLVERDPQSYMYNQRWMIGRLTARAQTLRDENLERDYDISLSAIDSLAEIIAVTAFLERTYDALQPAIENLASVTGHSSPYPSLSGLSAYERREYDSAIVSLSHSIARGIQHSRLYLFLGNALALEGRSAEALAVLEDGAARFPDDDLLILTLAKYYIRAGVKLERAKEFLEQSLRQPLSRQRLNEVRSLLHTIP